MPEATLDQILEEIRSVKSELADFKSETKSQFQLVQLQLEDTIRNVTQINFRILGITEDIASIKKDIWQIKDDLRKIKKFVATDHADFPNS